MKLYTIAWQNRPLVCLENRPGRLTPLPYETMNHLLADRPDHRAGVLEKAGKGSGAVSYTHLTLPTICSV